MASQPYFIILVVVLSDCVDCFISSSVRPFLCRRSGYRAVTVWLIALLVPRIRTAMCPQERDVHYTTIALATAAGPFFPDGVPADPPTARQAAKLPAEQ